MAAMARNTSERSIRPRPTDPRNGVEVDSSVLPAKLGDIGPFQLTHVGGVVEHLGDGRSQPRTAVETHKSFLNAKMFL